MEVDRTEYIRSGDRTLNYRHFILPSLTGLSINPRWSKSGTRYFHRSIYPFNPILVFQYGQLYVAYWLLALRVAVKTPFQL